MTTPVNAWDDDASRVVFDRSGLLDRVGGDEEFLEAVLEMFLDDAPRQIVQLRDMTALDDAAGVEKRAHSLKSAAGSAGARCLAQRALELEMAAQSGEANLANLVGTVGAAFDAFKAEIQNRRSV